MRFLCEALVWNGVAAMYILWLSFSSLWNPFTFQYGFLPPLSTRALTISTIIA